MPGGVWTENGKHSANYNVLAVCQGNVTLRIAVDNHIQRVSLAEWKDYGIQKQQCCQSCLENSAPWKAVQEEQAHKQESFGKQVKVN